MGQARVRRVARSGVVPANCKPDTQSCNVSPLSSTAAACKASAFQVLRFFLDAQAMSFAWCRLFYLYGEGENERRLVPYIRGQLEAGQEVLLTRGDQLRDFLDVKDAARMIADGRDLSQLRHAPWTSLFPGLAIGAAVLGFNLLGDALRDAMDPRALRAAIPRGAGMPDIARP